MFWPTILAPLSVVHYRLGLLTKAYRPPARRRSVLHVMHLPNRGAADHGNEAASLKARNIGRAQFGST